MGMRSYIYTVLSMEQHHDPDTDRMVTVGVPVGHLTRQPESWHPKILASYLVMAAASIQVGDEYAVHDVEVRQFTGESGEKKLDKAGRERIQEWTFYVLATWKRRLAETGEEVDELPNPRAYKFRIHKSARIGD